LEDLFTNLAADKTKLEATFHLFVDTTIMPGIVVHRVMFVFGWFMANIVDTTFVWWNFTRSTYVTGKRA
jgi:hypothetical protein